MSSLYVTSSEVGTGTGDAGKATVDSSGASRRTSLRKLGVGALLVAALLPLTVAAVLGLTAQRAALTSRVEDDLDQYADAQAARVGLVVRQADGLAQLVTSRTLLRELVAEAARGPSGDLPRITTILDDARDASDGLHSIVLLRDDGSRIAATSPLPDRPGPSEAALEHAGGMTHEASTVSDLQPGPDGPVWLATAPMVLDDALIAVAVLDLDPEPLLEVLSDRAVDGGSQRSISTCLYVAGDDGQPVAIERATDCPSSARGSLPEALLAAQAPLGDGPVFLDDVEDADGNPMVAATRALPEHGLGLVLSMSAGELLAPVTQATWELLGLFLAVALLAVATAVVVARRLTRPIVALQRATAQLADGDLASELPPSSLRELEDLRSSFESMKLAVLAEQAVQEDRYRDLEMLTHAMAHDLKGPLTVIRGMLELLSSGQVADEQDRIVLLQRSLGATLRMQRLIDDLLSLIRAIGAPLDVEPVALDVLVRDAISELELEEVATVGELPMVEGERTLLSQIVVNLLHNAAKYHVPGEPPRIEVSTGPRRGGMVALVIDDAGVGIPSECRSQMLETFARGDQEDHSSGTGLGLPIAKRVAERHGGGIELQDSPLGGTRVVVWLPDARRRPRKQPEGVRQSDPAVV